MDLNDFKIGNWFTTEAGKWLILDRGQRCVIAIREDQIRLAKNRGSYTWEEQLVYASIFDPYDFGGCEPL